MKKILLFIFLLTGIISSNAQSMFFPEAWTGRWKGNLSIFTKEGTVSTVEMNIVLEKTSTPNNYLQAGRKRRCTQLHINQRHF